MSEIVQAGKFLKEQSRRVEPNVIRTVYPEKWGYNGDFQLVETSGISFATSQIITTRLDHVGIAKDYGGKATDIPLANFGIETADYKVSVGAIATEWHWTELMKEQESRQVGYANTLNVVEEYLMARQKALIDYVHLKTLFGNFDPDNPLAFRGLLNNDEVEEIVEVTNLYTLTARQRYLYFLDVIRDYKKSTKLTGGQIQLVVSTDLYNALTKIDATADIDSTAYLLLTDPMRGSGVARIVEKNELAFDVLEEYGISAPGTDLDMYLLMDLEDNTVRNRVKKTLPFFSTPAALKDDGMTYRSTSLVPVSEVIYNQPYRCKYYRHPKQA